MTVERDIIGDLIITDYFCQLKGAGRAWIARKGVIPKEGLGKIKNNKGKKWKDFHREKAQPRDSLQSSGFPAPVLDQ